MPITARCTGCGQTLSVQDQYAGMQGKCPSCGTVITFPAAAPPLFPAAAPPLFPTSPAAAPAASAPLVDQPPPAMPGVPRTPFSLAGLDELASITVPAGLFCLFLEVIAAFLPWGPISGIRGGTSTLFLFLCLIVGAIVGSTFHFKNNLRLNAVIGAAFGMVALLVTFAEATHLGNWGPGLGLVASLGMLGRDLALALFSGRWIGRTSKRSVYHPRCSLMGPWRSAWWARSFSASYMCW